MSIEKKFIKNRAFKNLMAHVCANSLTFFPGVVAVASGMGAASALDHRQAIVFGVLGVTAFFGGILQFLTAGWKLVNDCNATHSEFWKKTTLDQEASEKKSEVSLMMLAIRDLSIESEKEVFTPEHYQQIANLLVDRALYRITFYDWMKSHGAVAVSTNDMLNATGLSEFYGEMDKIVNRMDKKTLKKAESTAFYEKRKTLPEGYLSQLSLSDVVVPAKKDDQLMELNGAIYNHYNYLLKHKVIRSFDERDYKNFARIIHEGQNFPSLAIKPLINFLKIHDTKVNWVELIAIFKDSFKGDINVYRELIKNLNEQKEKSQSAYEERQLQLEAIQLVQASSQSISHSVNTRVNGSVANEKSEDSALIEQSSNKNFKEVEKEKTPLAHCPYVAHQGYFYSDKWADLKTNYDTMMAHATQIDAQTLNQMNRMLNASLPLLVRSDVNLKEFPLLHPQSTKKLLSENLDLAIHQIKAVNQTIAADLEKELKITKNYQTMKMSG